MEKRNQTCCFTGHRMIPFLQVAGIRRRLEQAIEESIQKGYLYFGAGGALGYDTIAAQTVLKLRRKYPRIKLILVLPCKTQTRGWKQSDIDEYERIKSMSDKVTYISIEYTCDCMCKRNQRLVDNSSLCICYLDKTSGRTASRLATRQKAA